MGMGVNIPWVGGRYTMGRGVKLGGSIYHSYQGQYTMSRGVDFTWVGWGRYAMDRGSK